MDDETFAVVLGVLTGAIDRSDLSCRPPRAQVYTAIALILARRSDFLKPHNVLKVSYPRVLGRILVQGIPGASHVDTFMAASLKEELHQQEGDQVCLTPPPVLKTLVAAHGSNPAIEVFFEDVERGVREARFEQMQSRAVHTDQAAYYSNLIGVVEANGGVDALLAMQAALQRRLDGLIEEVDGDAEV